MYGGDFACPAIHVFMASATIVNNRVTNNMGDALRVNGGIVNVQDNDMETGTSRCASSNSTTTTATSTGRLGTFRQHVDQRDAGLQRH